MFDFSRILLPDFDNDENIQGRIRRFYTTDMEAEFIAHYLGSSMLTKGTTGLGVIQKPLRDKYFSFRKSTDNKLGPEIIIRINPAGILMIFPGPKGGQENEDFYELSSVHFIEAVHFVTLKQKDKKFYGAFVPIEEGNTNASQEKLFMQIDKKLNHLTKISHPPMVACVMRRPTGVKAVDCHMLVVPEVEDALRMADMVHRFQQHPDRRDVDNYGHGAPRHRYPNPDVIPRDFGPREPPRDGGSGKRNPGEDYEIYRGERLELRQDHFRRNDHEHDPRFPGNRSFESDRSFEKERSAGNYRDFERANNDRFRSDEGRRYPPAGPREDPVVRRPKELRTTNGAYVERDSLGREFEFDNVIAHERQGSGGDRAPKWITADRGGLSPLDSDRGGLSPRGEDQTRGFLRSSGEHGRSARSPQVERGPEWASRGGDGYRNSEPSYGKVHHPGIGPRMVSPRDGSPPRGRSPPRGHSSPRTPRSPRSRSPEDDGVYSASNLESRMEAEQQGKPVAKVPPHRHAGIRVLPSLPIPDAKHQLKHVNTKPEQNKEEKETDRPKYNLDAKPTYEDDRNPYDNNPVGRGPYNNNDKFRKDRFYSDNSEVEVRGYDVTRNGGNRVKSDGHSYNYDQGFQASKPSVARPWTFEEEKEKFLRKEKENSGWHNGYKSKSKDNLHDDRFETEYSGRGKNGVKDAEIADMFSNLRTGISGSRDIDFEQSLGYLP